MFDENVPITAGVYYLDWAKMAVESTNTTVRDAIRRREGKVLLSCVSLLVKRTP